MIVKVENNQIIQRDIRLSTEFPNTSFPEPLTQDALPDGYFILLPSDPVYPSWDENVVETDPVFVNGIPKLTYQTVKKNQIEIDRLLVDKKQNTKQAATNKRKQLESAGVDFINYRFDSDQISQTKLIGVYLFASQDPTFIVNWKTSSGEFVNLNAAQILQLVLTVRNHIQSCFDWEFNTLATINNANTYDELEAIKNQIDSTTL